MEFGALQSVHTDFENEKLCDLLDTNLQNQMVNL
jgi:hypothetical protein